jgi:hypothetical protein
MEAGFCAIGFKDIDHHHVTTPAMVSRSLPERRFDVVARNDLRLPSRRLPSVTLYHNRLLRKVLRNGSTAV